MVVALAALFISLTGNAAAITLITSNQIKDRTIQGPRPCPLDTIGTGRKPRPDRATRANGPTGPIRANGPSGPDRAGR